MRPVSGHEIIRADAAQCHRIFIGATVSHHTDGPDICEHCKVLAYIADIAGRLQLFPENRIRFPHNFEFSARDIPNDANG